MSESIDINRNDLFFFFITSTATACQRKIVIVPFFSNRYFQSRPEIFANLSDGSQVTPSPAVSAAMNRASDVTSKMVMGGLRHAVASNNASRAGGNGNTNTTVSPFLHRVPSFWMGRGKVKRTRSTIIFFFADFLWLF